MTSQVPSSDETPGTHLAAMFTALVASLDLPARRHLSKVVSHCHTRRHPVPDPRATPIFFFEDTDEHIQSIAQPHLNALYSHPSNYLQISQQTIQNTPLNHFCPSLDEKNLFLRMNPETKSQYVQSRLSGCDHDTVQRGYAYFQSLQAPHIPIKHSFPPQDPSFQPAQTPFVSHDSDEDMSDEEFSDGEMMYSDGEESGFSHISDVTRESQLVSPTLDKRPYFVETSAATDSP